MRDDRSAPRDATVGFVAPSRRWSDGRHSITRAVSLFLFVTMAGRSLPAEPPTSDGPALATPVASAGSTAPSPSSGEERGTPQREPGRSETPIEVSLRSIDNHQFLGDYYKPGGDRTSAGVLVVPELGADRKSVERMARGLRERGYHVLAIDDTGLTRNQVAGPGGLPQIKPLTQTSFLKFVRDLETSTAWLRARADVDRGPLGVVGVGLGGNLALYHANQNLQIGAIAVVFPGFGCERFTPLALFNGLGSRPSLLVYGRKRRQSDILEAYDEIRIKRPDLSREKLEVDLATEEGSIGDHLERPGLEPGVIDWVSRHLPLKSP